MKRGLLLLVLLLLVPTVVTGACNITDDTVISTSTSLAANETPCSVTDANSDGAIIINASDVALTCQNFQLSGNGTGYGIYSAKSGATIDSCDVTGYGNDVYFSSNYSSLINSILAGTIKLSGGHAWVWNNTLGGVSISGGWYENNTIINNTINGGISISSQHAGTAPWFKIINNTITMSTYKGKAIDATSATPVANAEISGNKITASSGLSYCIRLYGTYNTIKDNTMDCNFKGISFFKQSTNYNTIMNNVMTGGYLAFDFVNSHYNNITSNNVTDFSNAMAFASGAANNLFWNNYFYVSSAGTNSDNMFNITKTAGTNIIGGNWTAGNWWWNYLGDDTDGDNIGDTELPHYNDYAPIIIAPIAFENCNMNFSTLDIDAGRLYNFTNCNLTFGTVNVKKYGKLYIQDSVVDAESGTWNLNSQTGSAVKIRDSTLNNCSISSGSDLVLLTGNTINSGVAVSITNSPKATIKTNTFTGSSKKIYLSGSSNADISGNVL
ncbi:MAG: NosD domain-containing protein, partial [Candidatus Aenigmatarchaeota archaeon]